MNECRVSSVTLGPVVTEGLVGGGLVIKERVSPAFTPPLSFTPLIKGPVPGDTWMLLVVF